MSRLFAPEPPGELREDLLRSGFTSFRVRGRLLADDDQIEISVAMDKPNLRISRANDRWQSILSGEFPAYEFSDPEERADELLQRISGWLATHLDKLAKDYRPFKGVLDYTFQYDVLKQRVEITVHRASVIETETYTHTFWK